MRWNDDIPFADLQEVARRLEAFARDANAKALALARIEPGQVVEAFAATQARLLRFDDFGRRRFEEELETARVRTLAGDNVFLGCVMSAAVALSCFKRQPRQVDGRWSVQLGFLRARSTGIPALWLLSVASLTDVFGRGAAHKLTERRRRKGVMDV